MGTYPVILLSHGSSCSDAVPARADRSLPPQRSPDFPLPGPTARAPPRAFPAGQPAPLSWPLSSGQTLHIWFPLLGPRQIPLPPLETPSCDSVRERQMPQQENDPEAWTDPARARSTSSRPHRAPSVLREVWAYATVGPHSTHLPGATTRPCCQALARVTASDQVAADTWDEILKHRRT